MNAHDYATKRILVVEDESSISNMCRRVLTKERYQVDIAVNGRVAQDMIEEKEYNLCLIDIRTPKMSGIELYQWLEKKYPQLTSRVIFTTGSVMGGDAPIFMEQTGRPVLPKPFTPNELKAIVQEALKQI
jgi:DNA-binding response OmpR family regulator